MLARHKTPNNVIVGVRPEHLQDAKLIDVYERIRALTFQVTVELVESLGADKIVHFTTGGAGAQSAQLAELAAESGVGENEFVARLPAQSKVAAGQQVELAFDTSKIAIFDADSGINLTIPPMSDSREEQKAPMSDSREEQKAPMSDSREEQQPPMSDSREEQQPPMSDSREEQQAPMSDSREEQQAPMSDSREEQQPPMSDSREEQQPPMSDSREEPNTPPSE
jgi:hypothetical protein